MFCLDGRENIPYGSRWKAEGRRLTIQLLSRLPSALSLPPIMSCPEIDASAGFEQ